MSLKNISLGFVFLILCIGNGALIAQTTSETVPDTTIQENALSINEISSETEALRTRLKSLREVLKPNAKTLEVDSILDTAQVSISIGRDSLYKEIDALSRRELKIREVTWNDYKGKLKSVQLILNDRTEEVNSVNDELIEERTKWENTKVLLLQNTESKDVFASLDTMIFSLDDMIEISHVRLDSLFKVEKRITDLILVVDEAKSEIKRYERQKQKEYFTLDSPPIWVSETVDTNQVADTALIEEHRISDGISADFDSLKDFVESSARPVIGQLVFMLFVFVLLIWVNAKWGPVSLHLDALTELQVKTIIKSQLSSAVVIGVLVASFFYDSVVPVFSEIQIFLVLAASTYLIPRITTRKMTGFMLLIFAAFLIQSTEPYFESRSFELRMVLLLKSVVIFPAIYWGRKIMNAHALMFDYLVKVFNLIAPVYLFLTVASIFFNVIGMVNLADVLLNGIVISTSLGMVVFMAVKIITNLLLLVIQIRKSNEVQPLSVMVEATTKRFQPIIAFSGFVLWVIYTLSGFDVQQNVVDWLFGLLEITWEIGETKISLGSLLSFSSLFIGSIILAKLVASLFHDEWMLKVLPRGVAPAISLVLRIVVIGLGVYLAFSAAGYDVSKLGLVFGALSVGIGFGLQNVVLNFIAGLILAFERPINLGDAIEVDSEMGEVTNIGVRSSSIRTYSGAEAIIPNGDLISKKVVNWTLADRDRRSKIRMRTSASADPNFVIALFNKVATDHDCTFKDPAPKTYFYGYGEDGNLEFALLYWTTFSDTLRTNSEIALEVFNKLKEEGIEAPIPNQRNFK